MKKLFTIMAVVTMAVAFGVTAYAANTVQVTLTSPAIIKQGCEKVGAVTYAIDANTTIIPGDWWYFDLPTGAFVCKPIDYFMGAFLAGDDTDFVVPGGSLNDNVLLVDGATTAAGIPVVAANAQAGPFSNEAGAAGGDVIPNGNIYFRIKADVNSRRVWLYVYGEDAADSLTVPNDTLFKVKILDGLAHQDFIVTNVINNNNAWGDADGETINWGMGFNAPYPENTLCVNSEQMVGDLMFVSFDSKFDFLTFTGDSQIAHVIADNPISIAFCNKLDVEGDIPLAEQNACAFDYETPSGYCPDFSGNYIHLVAQQPFGVSTDQWDFRVTIDTPGVYFGGPATVYAYTPAENACDNPQGSGGIGDLIGTPWETVNEGGTVGVGYPGSSCAVSVNSRVRTIRTQGGAISALNIYDTLQWNFSNFVYDLTIVGAGTEVDLTITMDKWPCGTVFSGSTTIGTFVVNCGLAAGGTSALLFPWFPPMDFQSSNWWGGFSIINAGVDTGELVLTFWEVDGDRGTYNAGTLAPGEQYNPGFLPDLLPMITPNPANTGTLGDANFAMTAAAAFGQAGGFAFTGNGIEGTGYLANVLGSDGWQ